MADHRLTSAADAELDAEIARVRQLEATARTYGQRKAAREARELLRERIAVERERIAAQIEAHKTRNAEIDARQRDILRAGGVDPALLDYFRRTGLPTARPPESRRAPRRPLTPSRSRTRQSHRTRPGHRRTASTRAGPDDPPGEPPAGLSRHPRYGLVNDALAAILDAGEAIE
jgi:hypothetical protein